MKLVSTWKGRGTLAAVLGMAALGFGLVLSSAPTTSAQAAPSAAIKQVTLTPGEENPPTTANAIGYFSATLTDGKLEFDLSAVGPELTMSHIHLGAKGVNGPAIAFLFGPLDPGVGAVHPTGTIAQANLVGPLAGNWKGFTDALAKGDLYVNVHSKANPGGVIRAQLPATTLTPKAPATGSSVASNGQVSFGQGLGAVLLIAATGTLVFAVAKRRA